MTVASEKEMWDKISEFSYKSLLRPGGMTQPIWSVTGRPCSDSACSGCLPQHSHCSYALPFGLLGSHQITALFMRVYTFNHDLVGSLYS